MLRASVILPDTHQQVPPTERCYLPKLPRAVLERLGELLGVEMGRRLRNVREFSEALAVLETEVDEDREKLRRHQTRDYENDYYDDEYEDDRDFDYCEQERTRWEDEEDAAFQAAQQQGFEENNDNEEDDDE